MNTVYFFNGNPVTYGYVTEIDHARMNEFAAAHPFPWSAEEWDAYEEDNDLVRALYALAKKENAE